MKNEEEPNEQDRLSAELAENRALADVGEVAATVAHEFNSFLNALLLHIAVLELELPPGNRQGLADIRRQGKEIAALIQYWQRYRRRSPTEGYTSDLNQVVAETVKVFHDDSVDHFRVQMDLADAPMPLQAQSTELKRLCMFLLRNAAAVTPADGAIALLTERVEDKVFLYVADTGSSVATETLTEYFDLYPIRRPGTNSLELAACKTIVRRMQGRISAENGVEKGVVICVELPFAG
jgi:signal transduction histidine kinase